MKAAMILLAAVAVVGCGKQNQADTAADAEAQASLNAATTVCISELAGVRHTLEDLLVAKELVPDNTCLVADIQLEETGEPSAWLMRYQRAGDADWMECKSSVVSRNEFARECIGQMMSDLGGG